MFEIRFIRRMIRRRMTPIDQTVADKWKRRLAIAYGVLAWNLFGVIVYNCYDGKRDWPLYYGLKSEEEAQVTNREYFARHLGREGATVRLLSVKNWRVHEDEEYVLKKSEGGANILDLEKADLSDKDLPPIISKTRNDQ